MSGGKQGDSRGRTSSTTSNDLSSVTFSGGGLNFTLNLSDFSLYIFHPYGGTQRKMASPMYTGNDSRELGMNLDIHIS